MKDIGEPIMKVDLESFLIFLGFFLISACVYLFVWYECNLDDKRNPNNEDLLYMFES